jgi:hypothetical protein
MKNKITKLCSILLAAVLIPATAMAGGGTFQAVDAIDFNTGVTVTGAGTLTRHNNAIHLTVAMTGLTPGSSYSGWYVIFNKPENCAAGPGACAGPDIENPAVKAAVLNAGGFISTTDGTGYFTGTLQTGPAPAGMCCFGRLMHGLKSEVHIVLQDHGPATATTVAAEISNPTGDDQFAIVFPPTK